MRRMAAVSMAGSTGCSGAGLGDELLHLVLHHNHRGQDGVDGLAALLHLLVQQVVNVEYGEQTGATEDDHHGINLVEIIFAGVDDVAQVLGGASGQKIDGVGHRRASEELLQQRIGLGAADGRHFQSVVRQHVGEHHGGTAGMGNHGDVLALELGVHQHRGHGDEFLAAIAAHYARLAEQRVHGHIAAGQRARVAAGGAAAGAGAARLDGGYAASLADERRRVFEQLLRLVDALDVEQLDARAGGRVERLVHVLQHLLNANLGAVAHGIYAIESQSFGYAHIEDEQRRGARPRYEVDALRVERGYGG